jgi:hypothetical protein
MKGDRLVGLTVTSVADGGNAGSDVPSWHVGLFGAEHLLATHSRNGKHGTWRRR